MVVTRGGVGVAGQGGIKKKSINKIKVGNFSWRKLSVLPKWTASRNDTKWSQCTIQSQIHMTLPDRNKIHAVQFIPYLCQQSFPTARRTSKEDSSWSHQPKSLELIWITYWCLENTIPIVTRYKRPLTLHVQIISRCVFSALIMGTKDRNSAWCQVLTSAPGMRYVAINKKVPAPEEFILK